jgi:hypothetical protein
VHPDIDVFGFARLIEDDFFDHFAADVDPLSARLPTCGMLVR